MFQYLIRAQYLVTQGFQLLADHNLTSEEWKKLRANAKHRVPELAEAALASYAESNWLIERELVRLSEGVESAKEQGLWRAQVPLPKKDERASETFSGVFPVT